MRCFSGWIIASILFSPCFVYLFSCVLVYLVWCWKIVEIKMMLLIILSHYLPCLCFHLLPYMWPCVLPSCCYYGWNMVLVINLILSYILVRWFLFLFSNINRIFIAGGVYNFSYRNVSWCERVQEILKLCCNILGF